mgnify:CR=1 FL=1
MLSSRLIAICWVLILTGGLCYSSDNRFVVKDHIVIDLEHKIEWLRCSVGQRWDGNKCSGKIVNLSLDLVPEAINIANTGFTKDDTVFMNHMIIHHEQALILSRLAPNRTNTKEILDLAGRIDVSQEDEISFMQGWLEERDIEVHEHMSMHHMKMMGMASDQDIVELSNSKGMEFDELFLRLMIALYFEFH